METVTIVKSNTATGEPFVYARIVQRLANGTVVTQSVSFDRLSEEQKRSAEAGLRDTLMLDTNVFNHLLDSEIALYRFAGKTLVATHVQRDEIERTNDAVRRQQLLDVFAVVVEAVHPTESGAWNVSKWGQAKWGREDGVFESIKRALDACNGGKASNVQDALIAETALRNGWTLVTNDADLTDVATQSGCACIDLRERDGAGRE